jgi:hypothetical protein
VYCGTPCRQAAYRARQAAARAAEQARWLRASLGSAESELHTVLPAALAALAAVHDMPLPGDRDVPGGFEDGLMRQADAARRAWSRVHDLACDHARARRDCAAARDRGFGNAPDPAPAAGETHRRVPSPDRQLRPPRRNTSVRAR